MFMTNESGEIIGEGIEHISKMDTITQREFGEDWKERLYLAVAGRKGMIFLNEAQIEAVESAVKTHALISTLIDEALDGKVAMSSKDGHLVFGARAREISE